MAQNSSSDINQVTSGLYKGSNISFTIGGGQPYITIGFFKKLLISPETCESAVLESVAETKKATKNLDEKAAKNLEFFMQLSNAATGNSDGPGAESHNVVLTYKDGQKSVVKVDQKMWERIQEAMI